MAVEKTLRLRANLVKLSLSDGSSMLVSQDGNGDFWESGSVGTRKVTESWGRDTEIDPEAQDTANVIGSVTGLLQALYVDNGDAVTQGQVLAVVEAMKMEIEVKSPRDGIVAGLTQKAGDQVKKGAKLLTVKATVSSPV